MTTLTHCDLNACEFNWHKGMWETRPERWGWGKTVWVVVAMLWATTLERGVRP